MFIKEMFSPLGGPSTQEADIDWLDDLKFYIDNDDKLLSKFIFPAVEKHKNFLNHQENYRLYIRPLQYCLESYCNRFELEDVEEKFPLSQIVELAKKIAHEQEKHIKEKNYNNQ